MGHQRLVPEPCCPPSSSEGDSVMAYLTAVLTDLLHSQRDPLALCLLLQAYDQLAPPVPQLCCFSSYYRLWIPEPAQEAAVSGCHAPALPQGPACPGKPSVLPEAQLGCCAGDISSPRFPASEDTRLVGSHALWLLGNEAAAGVGLGRGAFSSPPSKLHPCCAVLQGPPWPLAPRASGAQLSDPPQPPHSLPAAPGPHDRPGWACVGVRPLWAALRGGCSEHERRAQGFSPLRVSNPCSYTPAGLTQQVCVGPAVAFPARSLVTLLSRAPPWTH